LERIVSYFLFFIDLYRGVDIWPCIELKGPKGEIPSQEELRIVAAGMNKFHDQYAVHMTDAQKYLLMGRMILEQLVKEKRFEAFLIQKPTKGGIKEKINWSPIIHILVIFIHLKINLFRDLLIQKLFCQRCGLLSRLFI